MAMEFRFFHDDNVFVTTYRGVITDAEMFESYLGMFNNPEFVLGMHEIADARECSFDQITMNGLRNVSNIVDNFYSGSDITFKTALLTKNKAVMMRTKMYQIHADQSSEVVQIFTDKDELKKWLGLPVLFEI